MDWGRGGHFQSDLFDASETQRDTHHASVTPILGMHLQEGSFLTLVPLPVMVPLPVTEAATARRADPIMSFMAVAQSQRLWTYGNDERRIWKRTWSRKGSSLLRDTLAETKLWQEQAGLIEYYIRIPLPRWSDYPVPRGILTRRVSIKPGKGGLMTYYFLKNFKASPTRDTFAKQR